MKRAAIFLMKSETGILPGVALLEITNQERKKLDEADLSNENWIS